MESAPLSRRVHWLISTDIISEISSVVWLMRFSFSGCLCLALASVGVAAHAAEFNPVTEQMLRAPAPGDWLNWRRTDDAWGYSPLRQINRENVHKLQLVWSWAMGETAAQETAPLVHDGIVYLPNSHGVIQALDGANGDLIWEYRPQVKFAAGTAGSRSPSGAVSGPGVQKNIAIFGDRIFGTTGDAHLVAINARNGELIWDVQVADAKLGYRYTAGPIVVKGVLITGISGCSRYKDDVCFITGHDAATGKELWRTSTVARPGEPGGDTWGDLPLRFRAGSDAWIAGSYDPETGLVYIGTAQAKPWASAVRGADGAALYTNSTLALNPLTGEMVWYYQHLPGETHDMDEVFENILVDLNGRKSLFKMGKIGILWQLDRTTGEFIKASDLGYQNMLKVNPRNGHIVYNEDMVPEIGVQIDMCPSTSGMKSWRAMAYSPNTKAMYIPLNLNCELATFGPVERILGGGGVGPVRRKNHLHPKSEGMLGEFVAMSIETGDIIWRHRTPSPSNTAALTTAGGVVFGGDWDRHVYAYDEESGDILWQTRLGTSAQGFPVTYLAGGKQYVAVPAGVGGASWSTLIPHDLVPEITRPNHGNSIYVFALPEQPQ